MPIKSKRRALIITASLVFILLIAIAAIAETVHYYYDDLNRLRRVEYENGVVIEYSYDEIGNRRTVTKTPDATPPTTTASPVGGTYNMVQYISLTCSDSAGFGCYNIYYTTDGSTPTTASSVYTAPITISADKTLKYFAIDSAGNMETVKTQTYTIVLPPAPVLDKAVTTKQSTASTSITSPSISTAQSNELLVAFIASNGPTSGTQSISTVTGGGLTWTMRSRANTQYGTAEIWTAPATTVVTNATVRATRATGSYQGMITVAAFKGASLTVNGAAANASASTGAPTVSLTTTQANSLVWGVGNDPSRAVAHTVGSSQTKQTEYLVSSKTYWVQYRNAPSTSAGATAIISCSTPTNDRWNLAAIEIVPAPIGSDTTPPTVTAFTVPSIASSLTVSITSFTATDNIGVSGYLVNEVATTPSPTAAGWSSTAPTSYTFVSAGNKTLYAWAKDYAWNRSTARSAAVNVDITAPVTTAAPAAGAYNSAQSVTLTSNETATIYYTTNGSTPTTSSTVYTSPISLPTNTTRMFKYFAKDRAGNSEAVNTSVYTIDLISPTGTFTISSGAPYALSTTVTLTTSAMDTLSGISQMQFSNDNVTWSTPATYATTTTWSLTPGDGTKTVYARFKDAAGNWSAVYSSTIELIASACSSYSARIVSTHTPPGCYSSLQAAYNAAADGAVIQSKNATYTEDLTISHSVNVTMEGGYNTDYSAIVGTTNLKGMITTSAGTVTIKNFILQQ